MMSVKAPNYFAGNVSHLIRKRNLTYKQVAEDVGITPTTLSAYKRDPSHMEYVIMVRFMEEFNVSYHELFEKNPYT